MPPATVLSDRYELVRVAGRGGMAEVWEANDRVLGRRVAVKVLHQALAADPGFIERFRREATAAASLNHPSMVAIFDAGIDGDAHYLVMEYLDGITLGDLLRQEKRLELGRVTAIGAAVAGALQAVHDAGLVHRDVKPANIMVTPGDGVKLMDLGIAHGAEMTALTATASMIGTAGYIAPEQAKGLRAEPRSDLYALGCVLFEAATGRRPFEADSPVAMAVQHVNNHPPAPSSLVRGLPHGFDLVMAQAMAKEPAQRYATAREFAEDLRQLGRGEGVAATATAPLAATAPLGATPGDGATATAVAPRPGRASRAERSPGGRGLAAWLIGLLAAVAVLAVLALAFGWFDTDGDGVATPEETAPTEPPATEPPPEETAPTEPPATEPPPEETAPTEPPATDPPPAGDFSRVESALADFRAEADAALAAGEIDESARDNFVDKAADAVEEARGGDDDALDDIESLRDDLASLSDEMSPSTVNQLRRTIDALEREIRAVL